MATIHHLSFPSLLPVASTATYPENLHRCSTFPTFTQRGYRAGIRATRSCSEAVVIAGDEKYGNKQVISVTPELYHYILANVREPSILSDLREETSNMRGSQMQVSPDQAQLLAMLVQILGAKRCIEVGVYTGYSSLAIALVLPESGCLVACERDGQCLEIAKRYYARAGVSHKVEVKHGLAVDALNSLLQNGEAGSYDFAFVDAEKKMYHVYYELLVQLGSGVLFQSEAYRREISLYLGMISKQEVRVERVKSTENLTDPITKVRPGGLVVIDNVLWHGKVADPVVNDQKTISIRNFNKYIFEDKRVSISMVPIGDGMTICRKL